MNNYTVADFIIRIKNAVLASRKTVVFPYAKLSKNLGNLLVAQGFLRSIKETDYEGQKGLVAELIYDKRVAMFTDVRIISKPSLRVYATKNELAKVEKRGLGEIVVSTSAGLMMGKEALKKGLGGELLFEIW